MAPGMAPPGHPLPHPTSSPGSKGAQGHHGHQRQPHPRLPRVLERRHDPNDGTP
jgi:hypothetical protein